VPVAQGEFGGNKKLLLFFVSHLPVPQGAIFCKKFGVEFFNLSRMWLEHCNLLYFK